MTNLACVLWWLVPGIFLGWLLSWLFDLLFRRNGNSVTETSPNLNNPVRPDDVVYVGESLF